MILSNNDCITGLTHASNLFSTTPTANSNGLLVIGLNSDSPAIDAESGGTCPSKDQNGNARPVDMGGGLYCDIGPIEVQN